MHEYDRLQGQLRDCGECLKTFLIQAVDKRPHLEEHAGIIREHLETLQRELKVLWGRLQE